MTFHIKTDNNNNQLKLDNEINKTFVELIEHNSNENRQSQIFLMNNNFTINSRHTRVELKDEALLIYHDDILKDIVDVNSIIAVITK